ncbi:MULTISPECIES: hypothetical protein [Rhizobium]|jgi:hypothetical protein|uniref:Uncharacterized protein n=1 Tax=Rhizobium lusitanum TaxID=293958 RepID=A0A1C3UXQ0_9HYPH|nr:MULTISPECIES: hypothetical protein [Rhizobium]NRP86866.1 hypothetical protein [Ensifer adhaerens]NKJ03220.1 hypothetical protein [Rhizobium sp. SG741]NKJ33412.1 hypothetical protein [Rhizobium sp. SG570]NTJ08368.1 hypothetical protein [Rhizobium lusitanum]SCB20194.1 hypothetical protein GA0061101_103515 [Rhizobium lusitanum]
MTEKETLAADADSEQQRLADLAEIGDIDLSQYAPGTFGCHEAMHTTSLMLDMTDDHLLQHPAIVADPEFYRLAGEVHEALFALYQAIGEKHLAD